MPRRLDPPLFLRLAVIVGLTTLTVGLVGAVVIVLRRPSALAVDGPLDQVPPSFAQGWGELEGWAVTARWQGEAGMQEVRGRLRSEGPGWVFPGAPLGVRLELVVTRMGPDGQPVEVLRRQRRIAHPDELVVID
jgi:hypothetical protein